MITEHRGSDMCVVYPHTPTPEGIRSTLEAYYVVPLNDNGPLDNYSRVLWLLQEAPELFISE